MKQRYKFPFGQDLKKVQQNNRNPKKAFVLGVYASAVHAKWFDNNGKTKVQAMAVDSEPEIFWTGENAKKIIDKIKIPNELGKLEVPKNNNLNGPSGRVLDNLYLKPLNLNRNNSWLCDLIPYSRVNKKQKKAIEKHYTIELIEKFNLNFPTIPDFDRKELNSDKRRLEILNELIHSSAKTILLLGDEPIRYFLKYFTNNKFKKLSDFGDSFDKYGKAHKLKINDKDYEVIPLCHPRQAGRLGNSSSKWGQLHDNWIKEKNKIIKHTHSTC